MTMQPYEPISLGHTCEVKYQLARRLGRSPGFADRASPRRHIFDYQVTPFSAVCAYLERGFEGVFERQDLFIDPVTGHVTHRSLWTSHPHEFEPPEAGLTEAVIDDLYPAARAKFEHLANRFREHLLTQGRFLYVFMELRWAAEAQQLLALLNPSPAHVGHLLFVDSPDRRTDLTEPTDQIFLAHRSGVVAKPSDRLWEGDDADWDAVLSPFVLTHYGA